MSHPPESICWCKHWAAAHVVDIFGTAVRPPLKRSQLAIPCLECACQDYQEVEHKEKVEQEG